MQTTNDGPKNVEVKFDMHSKEIELHVNGVLAYMQAQKMDPIKCAFILKEALGHLEKTFGINIASMELVQPDVPALKAVPEAT